MKGRWTVMIVGNFDVTNTHDAVLKYQIIQDRWKKLYSVESPLRLQDVFMKHVYKKIVNDETVENVIMMDDSHLFIFIIL